MASVSSTTSVVEALKAEANVLHGQGNYQGAYQKYSEAIKEKPKDPRVLSILFANRAASCLAMKEYLDALSDGQKAAQTDPSYVKGWVRVATAAHALGEWDVSSRAWTSALKCLPSETDLSPAEAVLKAQFEDGLKAADAADAKQKASVEGGKYHHEIPLSASNDFPWMRALALAEQGKLVKGDLPSSGFVILNAYRDFIQGITAMKQMVVKNVRGNVNVQSSPSGLTFLSNGIIRDERVFHADSQFFDRLEKQTQFETRLTNAWGMVGPKQIEKEVPERLRKLGWLPVRRALATTLRIWLLKGFFDSNTGALNGGVEFYKRILDVLEWGRRTYPNVPSEERGVIFEGSFVRGVRRLYIPAVLSLHLKNGDSCGYTLEDIRDLAEELKAETEASPRTPESYVDPGFYGSFWVYPVAEALSIIGWYHMQLGLRRVDKKQDFDPEADADFLKSSEYYIQAAEKYPTDDEKHPYFLAVAVDALWWGGAKLEVVLPLCRKIRAAMPEADAIWECSQMAKTNRNANCRESILFLEKCEDEIAEGTLSLDMALAPSDLLERRIGKLAQIQDK
ncbi:hypothetical protein B0H16DRAFT_1887816 [Mycena metata]|uniref:Uncharacterized protein n=1 Tax=Mycena metata TaxID=1033252 RepID=A0AAD7ITD5_9AGAR|nr:hypothetical protein B0H16DRAFT_1887816 [Mycena metata]